MDQQKMGAFLKMLRKRKGLTQEQFAEVMNVTNRSVSRWETGHNLPDIDILIQISDYYEMNLRDLLDGERKSEIMKKETEETVLKAVDYSNMEFDRFRKRVHWLLILGLLCEVIDFIIRNSDLIKMSAMQNVSDCAEGLICGIIIGGVIMSSRYGIRLRQFKKRALQRPKNQI